MADTGFKFASVVANDTAVGTTAWGNPQNVLNIDSVYAISSVGGVGNGFFAQEFSTHLVVGGSIVGTDLASNSVFGIADTTFVYGGSANLWGMALSATDINSSNFGVVYTVRRSSAGTIVNYLKTLDYKFNIPGTATVNGVQLTVTGLTTHNDGTNQGNLDTMQMKVFYSTDGFNIALV